MSETLPYTIEEIAAAIHAACAERAKDYRCTKCGKVPTVIPTQIMLGEYGDERGKYAVTSWRFEPPIAADIRVGNTSHRLCSECVKPLQEMLR